MLSLKNLYDLTLSVNCLSRHILKSMTSMPRTQVTQQYKITLNSRNMLLVKFLFILLLLIFYL